MLRINRIHKSGQVHKVEYALSHAIFNSTFLNL